MRLLPKILRQEEQNRPEMLQVPANIVVGRNNGPKRDHPLIEERGWSQKPPIMTPLSLIIPPVSPECSSVRQKAEGNEEEK